MEPTDAETRTVVAAPISGARRRVIDRLKRTDAATAPELAADLDLTGAAVRQHLDGLAAAGLVEPSPSVPTGPGRPPKAWRLTHLTHELFPDRHADLTVALIETIRTTLGEEALDKVVAARSAAQEGQYRAVIPQDGSLLERAEALARQRTAEGYVAEAVPADDGSVLLIEHHCPICDAASACLNLCRGELSLFRAALGSDVSVERSQHLLSGDQRCAYRISSNPTSTSG